MKKVPWVRRPYIMTHLSLNRTDSNLKKKVEVGSIDKEGV